MAVRWIESFEGVREMTQLARLYATATGTIATETGARIGSALSSANLLLRSVDLLYGAADENVWIVGFHLRNNSGGFDAGATTIPYVSLRNAGGEQLRVEFIAANESKPGGAGYKLRVMRGATTLAVTNEVFNGLNDNHAWVYFEFKATIRTGTNGSFSLKYHRRRTKNLTATWTAANTGVNTANQGADGADRFEFALTQSPATSIALDNICVIDGSGSLYNDFVGEVDIEAIDVTGDGATVTWDLNGAAASLEDAWNEGDTVQNTTEDDKRVTSKDPGDLDLAALANPVSIRTVPVVAVMTRVAGRMDSSGSRNIQFFYRKTTGSPAQVGTRIVTLSSTSLVAHADCRETDPNTSAAWVVADIDGLQAGVELDA